MAMSEQSFPVTEAYKGMRLDRFLQAMVPRMSRAAIQEAIEHRIRLASERPPKAAMRPAVGDVVHFAQRVQLEVPDVAIPVLAEGDGWTVVDKPGCLASTPSARRPGADVATMTGKAPAHRLDYGTSGCLLLVHDKAVAQHFERAFRERRVLKQYLAVVHGTPTQDTFTIDAPIGRDVASRLPHKVMVHETGAPAITDITVIERRGTRTLVRAEPRTGRRHQIRVHLAHAGHALIGDLLYGPDERNFIRWQQGQPIDTDDGVPPGRHLLHAHKLSLPVRTEPGTFRTSRQASADENGDSMLHFEAPLPDDFNTGD